LAIAIGAVFNHNVVATVAPPLMSACKPMGTNSPDNTTLPFPANGVPTDGAKTTLPVNSKFPPWEYAETLDAEPGTPLKTTSPENVLLPSATSADEFANTPGPRPLKSIA
jgi:hypothetical protein